MKIPPRYWTISEACSLSFSSRFSKSKYEKFNRSLNFNNLLDTTYTHNNIDYARSWNYYYMYSEKQ